MAGVYGFRGNGLGTSHVSSLLKWRRKASFSTGGTHRLPHSAVGTRHVVRTCDSGSMQKEPTLVRNCETLKKASMRKLAEKKFQVFNPRQRRSFGKNRVYCPLQGHSTTDYVLSESIGSVFSTGFVSDNIMMGVG